MIKVLLSDTFIKKEFKSIKKQYTIDEIIKTAVRATKSSINLSQLGYTHGSLVKVRMVSKVGGRMVAFIYKSKDIVIPIVVRLKSDKIFGKNLALNNKRAKDLILQMINVVMNDIESDKYKKIEQHE